LSESTTLTLPANCSAALLAEDSVPDSFDEMWIETTSEAVSRASRYASAKAPMGGWDVVGRDRAASMRAKNSGMLRVRSGIDSPSMVTVSGTTTIRCSSHRCRGRSDVLSVTIATCRKLTVSPRS
jgi:hypothetical protein